MRHDWILDVLSDLSRYAQDNRLPALSDGADALLRLAQAELAALRADTGGAAVPGGPPGGRPH